MRNLNLSIHKVYFNGIRRGSKTTEFRDIKPYWIDKLVDKSHYEGMTDSEIADALYEGKKLYAQKYDTATFFCGDDHFTIEIKGIETYKGHRTFAIALGKIIK